MTNRRQISLKLALEQASMPLDLSNFRKRLVFQKLVYLIQKSGVHLGFSFSWYLRGPYSPGLTEDAFNLATELDLDGKATAGWVLDEKSIHRIDEIKGLWEGVSPNKLPRHLELLASVHYLLTNKWTTSDPQKLSDELKRHKKPYSPDEARDAVELLKRYRLLPR